jgi:hypothetical protein
MEEGFFPHFLGNSQPLVRQKRDIVRSAEEVDLV